MAEADRVRHDEQQPLLAGQETSYAATNGIEEQPVQGFGKQLNAFNGYSLLISCIIGSGIFASPAAVDTNVPSPGAALLIWLVGGLLAWTGAATLAELGTAFPGEGSVQEYLKYIYGDFAGFLAAYTWIVAIVPSTLSILSIVFIETAYSAAHPASEGTASGWGYKGLSILVLVANVLLNSINTKTSARLGNFFAAIKLLSVILPILAGLIVATIYAADHSKDFSGQDWHKKGWFDARPSITPDGTTDWSKISTWKAFGHYSAAIYASLWAYCGWDGANYIAAELKDPGRQLPLALNTAIPTVMVSYVLVNAAYYILLPWNSVGLTDAIAVVCVSQAQTTSNY
jgi:L-type amino acid transporter 9